MKITSVKFTGCRIDFAQSKRSFKKQCSARRGVPKQGEGIVTYVKPLRGCHNEAICRLLDEHRVRKAHGTQDYAG